MMRKMEPRELLQQLMDRDGLNTNSLAARLNNATKQSQIHRYLSGDSKEPRRSTLEPIAAHFRIPLDALYDPVVAEAVAKQKRLIVGDAEDANPALESASDVGQPSPKLSQNALALALMYDHMQATEDVKIKRMRAAVDALLGIERPTSSPQKVAARSAESKETRPA